MHKKYQIRIAKILNVAFNDGSQMSEVLGSLAQLTDDFAEMLFELDPADFHENEFRDRVYDS